LTTRISIIIPVYNEQATILELLGQVRRQAVAGFEFEVIVIDDGSKDDTVRLLEANPSLYTRLVKQAKNGGKGAAVRAGLRHATGSYVLFQDADLEYSPSDYAKLLYPVKEFGADVVMGSRFLAPQYTRVVYFWHKVGNVVITLFFNVLFNTTFSDIYSCYLLYRRDLVSADELVSDGWDQHAEILARAVKRAKVLYEVPIGYHGRTYDEGKKIRSYHAIPVILMIVRRKLRG
jgi:glycosyltransferase involved in cell wall biosynthesis